MDWRSIRFDWNHARAFLVTAEEGSYSAAARALGVSQPTIGRQVAALEEELGVALFDRVGTRLQLTPSGTDLLEQVRAMGQAATSASLTAAGKSEAIEGTVAITASEAISAFLLPPILARLRLEHPGIEIELVTSNQIRDLHRREADIAIRNARPTHPDLIGRKLRDATGHFYASPAYIERVGPFDSAEDLLRAELFAFDRSDMMIDALHAMDIPVTREQFPIVSPNHLVQWELCKQGVGICMMMDEVGAREPAVVKVLPELPSLPVPMWVVSHRELRTSRRLRLVYDLLVQGLG